KDPDVLPVALLLPRLTQGEDPHIATPLAVQQEVSLFGRKLRPWGVRRDHLTPGEDRKCAAARFAARLCPRIDVTATQRSLGVGNHKPLIVLQRCAESVARLTGTARAVEGEELRRGSGCNVSVIGALETLRERKSFRH